MVFFQIRRETILLVINNNIHESIYMQSLLKTPKCFFLSLFPLEIAVSYWLTELLFHIFVEPRYWRFYPLCVVIPAIVCNL